MKRHPRPAKQPATLEQVTHEYIDQVLEATLGNKTLAAQLLGIDRSTLLRKLARRAEQQGTRG